MQRSLFTEAVQQLRRHREEQAMERQGYRPSHMEAFLLNYALLVRDLAEVAAEWPTRDEEERGHHRAALLQTWGNRHVLGQLFRAGRLSDAQEVHLAELDRLLLEQAARMEQGYGLELRELLAIFRWGTPLTKAAQPVRLEVEPALLDGMATALTPAAQR
jgi:hypothetical protein